MELKIGTQLILEPTHTEKVERFRCKVVEQMEDMLFIDYPINVATKKTVFLLDGTQFRATFLTENKQSFAFNTEVLGRRSGNIPMIMLVRPSKEEFIKIQRREYVRVDTPADVAVNFDNQTYQFVTHDISAGGIALNLNRIVNFKDGDMVNLTIVLPFSNGEIKYIQTDARIVRIFDRDNLKIASIQFSDTDEMDQQLIVRFCFERQLIIRKKEMNTEY